MALSFFYYCVYGWIGIKFVLNVADKKKMGGVNEFLEAKNGISYLKMGFADGRDEMSLLKSYEAVKEKIKSIDANNEGLLLHCERGKNRYYYQIF